MSDLKVKRAILWRKERLICVALLIVPTLVTCSTFPRSFTCADMDIAPVTDAAGEITASGFSIIPPRGPSWCYSVVEGFGVVFLKNTFGGRVIEQMPPLEEQAHTFAAIAYTAEVSDTSITNQRELSAFVEQWLKNGMSEVKMLQDGAALSSQPCSGSECAHLVVVESEVTNETPFDAVCAAYSGTLDQEDNPRAGGDVLTLEVVGYACLHPKLVNSITIVEYSERYIKGRRPGPSLMDILRPEVEPFVRSLRLAESR